jgi:hypothetical protein
VWHIGGRRLNRRDKVFGVCIRNQTGSRGDRDVVMLQLENRKGTIFEELRKQHSSWKNIM